MFQLQNMADIEITAVVRAVCTGHGQTSDGRNPGQVSSRALPKCLCHGTTIENALQIICDGSARTSPGPCGHGIYSLASTGWTNPELLTTFNQLKEGGYHRGAVLAMEPAGILVKTKRSEEVPHGCTSWAKRENEASHQYSSHPGVLTYRYLIVNVAGLVEQLNRELSRSGHSTELNEHLMTAAKELYAPPKNVIPPGLPK